ncbi:MAG TPA: L,D-transpeptidase [Xanthobacteraceae bacterium]|nr:L,D-transpeptidase [Xanthobacteraceae bacterium]
MRPIHLCVLLAGVVSTPAWADPLAIDPNAYAANQRYYSAAAQNQRAAAYQQSNYSQPAANPLGGGLLEFLFGGLGRQGASQAYQPAQPSYSNAPQQGYGSQPDYQQQAATPPQGYDPSSDGDMAHPPIDPKFERQVVAYNGHEQPGTIIIDTPNKFLYLVEDEGKALRYGIGVGRPGFTWAGEKTITAKREWPDWRPPDDMIKRRPDLPRYMAGGPDNPLGARAMYLGSTLYRIHGSNEPWTIGTNVSSGCIRLRNADVIDLYQRVKVGTKVVVM